MKKLAIFTVLLAGMGLTACNQRTPVEVAKVTKDSTTAISQQAVQKSEIPLNFPAGATALCRDGSYSTAKDKTACAGNGGVAISVDRYHAE